MASVGGVLYSNNDPKHMCCCGCMHSKTGALVIGILEAIGIGLCLIFVIVAAAADVDGYDRFHNHHYATGYGRHMDMTTPYHHYRWLYHPAFLVPMFCISATVITLLLVGVTKERAKLLIPHMVLQIVGIVLTCVLIIILVAITAKYAALFDSYNNASFDYAKKKFIQRMMLVMTAVVGGLAVRFWIFSVIYKCYRYLGERANAMKYAAEPTMVAVPIQLGFGARQAGFAPVVPEVVTK